LEDIKIKRRIVELLAPAGDNEALKAAINNGADAVYIGAPAFNARTRAKNFTVEEVMEAIDYAHVRAVRVYLALNTLLTDNEIQTAAELALKAWQHGVDAIIVQDMGFAALLRRTVPDIILHASTQATIYDENALQACADIGFSRVILPRELSLADIRKSTAKAHELQMGIEVFIHGALCVCYSGQCLMSGALGGRSGNRGECAQPCRLEYELETAGKIAGKPFPRLGIKDIAAIDHINELAEAGVDSFKIEGRMRQAEYVGIVTGVYRKAIDEGTAGAESETDLLLAFNRGGRFSDHYLRADKSDSMMTGSRTGSHGVHIGDVTAINARLGVVEYAPNVTGSLPGKGDVISVRRTGVADEICSAPISEPAVISAGVRIKGFHPDVIERIKAGDRIFRMSDAVRIRAAMTADSGKTIIKGVLSENSGESCIEWTVAEGPAEGFSTVYCDGMVMDQSSESKSISAVRCAEQLSKTGGTPFAVSDINVTSEPSLPISMLNKLRRESLEKLENDLKVSFRRNAADNYAQTEQIVGNVSREAGRKTLVSVYLYEWDGTYESLECGADIYELPVRSFLKENAFESVRILKEHFPEVKTVVYLPPASNGAFRSMTEPVLKRLSKEGIDALMSGSPGNGISSAELGLCDMRDSSANVFNSHCADMVFGQGAYSLVPSHELGLERIRYIVGNSCNSFFELPAYGRIRLMHSEHCPVGYNKPGCRVCLNNPGFRLRDRKGAFIPVVCHPEVCTAEILSPDILCAPEEVVSLAGETAVILRLYFYDENIEIRRALVSASRDLMMSKTDSNGTTEDAIVKFRSLALGEGIRTGNAVNAGFYIKGIS
jgi:putative protease